MKKNLLVFSLFALVLSAVIVPGLAAQEGTYEGESKGSHGGGGGGGTRFGLQAGTSFHEALLGFQIRFNNLAITPRIGLGVVIVKDNIADNADTTTAFSAGFGSGFDWYFTPRKVGKVLPFIGNDFMILLSNANINNKGEQATRVHIADDIHVGVEYWFVDNLSLAGNVGVVFGFAKSGTAPEIRFNSPTTPTTFDVGLSGKLLLTYYF